jgi:hypothetical protein
MAFGNPQLLARQRKIKSIQLALIAGALCVLPIGLWLAFKIVLPLWAYVLYLLFPRLVYLIAKEARTDAAKAEKGAKAEEHVGGLLQFLERRDWKVQRNVKVDKIGDIDFFLTSPEGNHYVVEVKSHSGAVCFDGKLLHRLDGADVQHFEKDFLWQVMRQAITLRDLHHLNFVVPILVFTNADLKLDERKLRHVNVLHSDELIGYLEKYESETHKTKSRALSG